MKKRLIIPVDFSPFANEQLRLAASWKSQYDLDLVILHKIDLVFPSLSSADARLKMEYELKRQAKNQVNELLEEVGLDINTPTYIFTESLVNFILNSKTISQEDIIVVGMKGAGMLTQLLIGSTTTQLIDNLSHIIIGVPLDLKELYPEKLMVGIHHKSGLNTKSFSDLLKLISPTLNFVEFVSMVDADEDKAKTDSFLQQIQGQFSSLVKTDFKTFEGQNAFTSLKQFYGELDHSFLVVQRGSRSFSDHVFRKFMVNDLVFNSFSPLIILP